MELQLQKNTLIFTDNQDVSLKKDRDTSSAGTAITSPIFNDLIDEAGEEVFSYLDRFGFTQNTNVILLSSSRHYLYGSEELKRVSTVVNLKLMNHILLMRYCLHSMNRVLPIGGNYIGRFIDSTRKKNKASVENSVVSKSEMILLNSYERNRASVIPFITLIYKFFNRNKIKSLTQNKTRLILEKNGFLLIDMTEINGITYFISKKIFNVRSESFSFFRPFNKC